MMSVADDCVFCKIVAGEIPCTKIFEDEFCLSFLDVGPLADGHTLLIPKAHYGQLPDVPPETMAGLASQLPRIGRAIVRATGAEGFNVLQNNGRIAGQVVPHVHFHLIPRKAEDGLGYRWNAGSYPAGRADEIARRITELLE